MPVSLERIAEIITTAPGWTRVGITAPDPRTRVSAVQAFAAFILERLDERSPPEATAQIGLSL